MGSTRPQASNPHIELLVTLAGYKIAARMGKGCIRNVCCYWLCGIQSPCRWPHTTIFQTCQDATHHRTKASSIATVKACPRCRDPVTFGGGMERENVAGFWWGNCWGQKEEAWDKDQHGVWSHHKWTPPSPAPESASGLTGIFKVSPTFEVCSFIRLSTLREESSPPLLIADSIYHK